MNIHRLQCLQLCGIITAGSGNKEVIASLTLGAPVMIVEETCKIFKNTKFGLVTETARVRIVSEGLVV